MSGEEAIKRLKWFKDYNEEDYCGGDRIQNEYGEWYYKVTEEDFEAFDIAINALEKSCIYYDGELYTSDNPILKTEDKFGEYSFGGFWKSGKEPGEFTRINCFAWEGEEQE